MWIIVGSSLRNLASPETMSWGCIAVVLAANYEYCILLYLSVCVNIFVCAWARFRI